MQKLTFVNCKRATYSKLDSEGVPQERCSSCDLLLETRLIEQEVHCLNCAACIGYYTDSPPTSPPERFVFVRGKVNTERGTLPPNPAMEALVERCSEYSGWDLSWCMEVNGVRDSLVLMEAGKPKSKLVVSLDLTGNGLEEYSGRLSHWAITPEEQKAMIQALKNP